MNTLFPIDSLFPPGFSYTGDFISEEEERNLLDAVKAIDVHPMIFQGFEAKRKVASFGYDYSFDSRQLKRGEPIPDSFQFLIAKVAKHLSISADNFAELLVTEYPVGSVINWHRDAPPFDIIVGISLMEDCIFRFRPYDKTKQGKKSIVAFPVQRRSLYSLGDQARNEWEHSILPMKGRRYSITLRTLKR